MSDMGSILRKAIFEPSQANSKAFEEMMFKQIARAVYHCGCEVHYARGTTGIKYCHEHDFSNGPALRPINWLPHKQYSLENIEQGANEGLYVIWCPVPIMPKHPPT